MAKNDQYFPHDYQARNDVKCLFLRQQLGMEGYGIFWFLVESLADAGGLLPLKIIPVLAMQMQLPEVKVQSVITKFELFELTESDFFSLRLNKHLELRNMLSIKGKEGATKRWINSHPIAPPISGANAKERKVKEIKVKEKVSSTFVPPTKEDAIIYFFSLEIGYEEAEKFVDYYNSKGWMVGRTKMKDWKAAARNWKKNIKTYGTNTNRAGKQQLTPEVATAWLNLGRK